MSLRSEMAEKAAREASEAARVLQQRGQEARAERAEAPPEPAAKEEGDEFKSGRFKRNDNHEQAMNEVVERHKQSVAEDPPAPEFQPAPQPPKKPTPPESAPAAEPAPAVAAEAAPEVPAAEEAPAPVEMVKVKVDGEEFDVPKSEIDEAGGIAIYRITRAAENRLRKANETVAEAKRMQAEITAQALRVLQPPQPPQPDPANAALQKLSAARFGSDEEFAVAMRDLMTASAPRQPDAGLIVTQATLSMKHDMAFAKFRQDYADLVTNPELNEFITMKVQKRLAPYVTNGQPDWGKLSQVDFQEVYSTIGNQVRSLAAPRPSQPQPQAAEPPTTGTPSQASDKEARKASIVNLPTASARAEKAVEKELSYDEARHKAIADMKRSRGLPVD